MLLPVLHPGLKLEYFRQHQWEEEWIDAAENMTRDKYVGKYEKTSEPKEKAVDVSSVSQFP